MHGCMEASLVHAGIHPAASQADTIAVMQQQLAALAGAAASGAAGLGTVLSGGYKTL